MEVAQSSGIASRIQESPGVAYTVIILATLFVCWALVRVIGWFLDIWVSRQAQYNTRMVWKHGQPNRRRFPSDVRGRVFWLAQGRCEHWGPIFPFRCRRAANHADHWYAWSMGGKSTDRNAVALCEAHNGSKSAKIPSSVETAYIYIRRRLRIGVLATIPGEWEYKRFDKNRLYSPKRRDYSQFEEIAESPVEYDSFTDEYEEEEPEEIEEYEAEELTFEHPYDGYQEHPR